MSLLQAKLLILFIELLLMMIVLIAEAKDTFDKGSDRYKWLWFASNIVV